ncbi:DUF397 domain-containing protein [Streptomyces gilvosporeus]|uniref:DUF397 domain-containing protein n=1 Tax=Streptomyces gilvosporeus TaxID=553510 RepID=A0A1V0TJ98_9ACTN|nr:DUF397 domain-containing protein [Streptomyces gilvosporeus]ARF53004.1 DUF397 domain-containing protein [Streptomyces gilvosporeus]
MSNKPDLNQADWVKSSYSGGNGGQCVEYSKTFVHSGTVPVRDSKHPQSSVLIFSVSEWSSFVSAVKRGEFST